MMSELVTTGRSAGLHAFIFGIESIGDGIPTTAVDELFATSGFSVVEKFRKVGQARNARLEAHARWQRAYV